MVDNGSTGWQRGLDRGRITRKCGCWRCRKIWVSAEVRTQGSRRLPTDIVVLLNSDMRVEADFLAPLLAGFTDETVFAVSCQIFLGDKAKRREETGLTEGWWQDGGLRVGHREDAKVDRLFPCFYGGGGSCAFDRHKFLELGRVSMSCLAPFYLEDTDLGFLAWKRGWKVLYQPASVVHHEHRGTIGKRFRRPLISIPF